MIFLTVNKNADTGKFDAKYTSIINYHMSPLHFQVHRASYETKSERYIQPHFCTVVIDYASFRATSNLSATPASLGKMAKANWNLG